MGSHDFIDEVLKVPNIVEQLWKFSAQNDYPELKEMALWALNNIAAGWCQHTRVVVASGGIPKLLKLCISKESLIVKMQAIWALGNIAVYSQKTKHQILELGATTLYPLVCMLKDTTTDKSLSSVIMFALLNFFRERIPSKLYFQLQPPISVLVSPTLVDILSMENTREELVLIALHMFACFLASGLYKKDVDKANMYAQIPKFLVHHPKWKEVPNYALLIIRDVDESNKQVDGGLTNCVHCLGAEESSLHLFLFCDFASIVCGGLYSVGLERYYVCKWCERSGESSGRHQNVVVAMGFGTAEGGRFQFVCSMNGVGIPRNVYCEDKCAMLLPVFFAAAVTLRSPQEAGVAVLHLTVLPLDTAFLGFVPFPLGLCYFCSVACVCCCEVLIDNQVLLGLKHLIEVEGLNKRGGDKFIRKGVCRAIANFTAGTSGQLQVRGFDIH
ncbi:importin subunit alpha [Trifolium pratense]|uniref:Importin subunit alpha n=1 Tax=Trifolium pratense TaxID=57577 RepID=A0A2K3P7S1_TRIPR|nr:importin subunit alpha [Trifolium pratense]